MGRANDLLGIPQIGIGYSNGIQRRHPGSLQKKRDHNELVEIIRQYKAAGKNERETYNELQEIWLAFGFDEDDGSEPNPVRDNLELVMELVWGFCPQGRAIWGKSLSNEDFS